MKLSKLNKKIFYPISEDFYRRPIHYTEDQKNMGAINPKFKPLKIRYLYDDIKDNINKGKLPHRSFSKKFENYNQTITYKSTYFTTKGNKIYDYSNIKSRLYEKNGDDFQHIMNQIHKKMQLYNILYKNQGKKTRNKILIGDKNQMISSSMVDNNKISNKNVSRNAYRKTMTELYTRIRRIKSE